LKCFVRETSCATNSSDPNTGVEIIVPGLGLLFEQNPLADRPISLSARRAFSFWSGSRDSHPDRPLHGRRCCCYTTILQTIAEFTNQWVSEWSRCTFTDSLTHQFTNSRNGAPGRTRTDEYEFTKLALWLLRHRGVINPKSECRNPKFKTNSNGTILGAVFLALRLRHCRSILTGIPTSLLLPMPIPLVWKAGDRRTTSRSRHRV
jgi:hypothetical protein